MTINARRALGNFGAFAAMRFGTAALSFAFFVYLARQWNREMLGEFTTMLAIFFLLYQLPVLGLHVPVIRELAQKPERRHAVLGNLVLLSTVFAVLMGAGLGVFGVLSYPREMWAALWLVAACLLPSAVSAVAETDLMASERMGTIAAVNTVELLLRTAGWCILVWKGAGLAELAMTLFAGRLLAAALYLRGGFWKVLRRSRYSMVEIRVLLSIAPVYMGLVALTAAVSRMDFVILSQLADLDQVGMYAAPYKLYEAGMMIPTILIVVIFPGAARLYARSADALDVAARQLCRVWVTVGLPVVVVTVALGAPLLRLLFGEPFVPAAPALAWLAVVPVIASVDITMSCVLQASHQQTYDLRALAIAFAVYMVALVLLIPPFGFVGAAAATAIGAFIQAWLRYGAARTRARISPVGGVLLPPVIAAAAMSAATMALVRVSLLAGVLVGLLVYMVVLAVTRGITGSDLRFLREMYHQGARAA